jgi:thioredoxin 1
MPMLLHEFNWKKEVVEATEPVLVDFWASWCPPCLAMNPAIEALARDFKVCKVNVDTNQELASPTKSRRFQPCSSSKAGKLRSGTSA